MGNLDAHAIDRAFLAHADAAATLRDVIRRTLTTLRTWHWRVRSRRQLLMLDDRMLADIGLSRVDAASEAAKPFWQA